MERKSFRLSVAWGCVLSAMAGACAPVEVDESAIDGDPDGETRGLVVTKGLQNFNGLSGLNGLRGVNGLTTTNGLTTANGLTRVDGVAHLNGLATYHGSAYSNGKPVNCFNVNSTTACTGEPDGLFSKSTGMLTNVANIEAAGYVVRCALASNKGIKVKRWDNQFVTMNGLAGLAPEWETGLCDTACQEKVTACLLAFVNDTGTRVPITLSAGWLGPIDSAVATAVESSFYGNIFTSSEAYVVSGYDHARTVRDLGNGTIVSGHGKMMLRYCSSVRPKSYQEFLDLLPRCSNMRHVGSMGTTHWVGLPASKCKLSPNYNGTIGRAAAVACSGPDTTERRWLYPITTSRGNLPWTDP